MIQLLQRLFGKKVHEARSPSIEEEAQNLRKSIAERNCVPFEWVVVDIVPAELYTPNAAQGELCFVLTNFRELRLTQTSLAFYGYRVYLPEQKLVKE